MPNGLGKSKSIVLKKLAAAALEGSLGLVAGPGFAKAIMPGAALDWKALMTEFTAGTTIALQDIIGEGMSYPQIISSLCYRYAQEQELEYTQACRKFKERVAMRVHWSPAGAKRAMFAGLLKEIEPAWLITTNYDTLLEAVLFDACSLSNKEPLTLKKNRTPVYHLYGSWLNPESIIATQEDFMQLFVAGQYHTAKFSTMLKESTTLFLGYSLNDVPLLTAGDWSKSSLNGREDQDDFSLVQLNCLAEAAQCQNDAYTTGTPVWILDALSIEAFLHELVSYIREEKQAYVLAAQSLQHTNALLSDNRAIEKLLNDEQERKKLKHALCHAAEIDSNAVLIFISQCLYLAEKILDNQDNTININHWLKLILSLFSHNADYTKHPAVLMLLTNYLDKIACYIYSVRNVSFSAKKIWCEGRHTLRPGLFTTLTSYAQVHTKKYLRRLLDDEEHGEILDVFTF